MAYDGSGNYSLPPGSIVTDGTTIDAADHNVPVNDIAAALSQVLLRSGVAPMTGDLNMAGFSIVNQGGINPGLGTDNTWTGANYWTGTNAWSGSNFMTTTASQGIPLEIASSNGDGVYGPILSLYRNSPTPASGDSGGGIIFYGKDSAAGKNAFGSIVVVHNDVTNGSEDGIVVLSTALAGAFGSRLQIGAGVYHPLAGVGPGGGSVDKGNNTINFGTIYQNGAAVASALSVTELVAEIQALRARVVALEAAAGI